MNPFIVIPVSVVAGALATSFAEYFLNYNLVDFVKDKALALFGKAKADVKDVARKF